jgi:NAD(P)-dependent dehydrogenase (short-subunit alcohol dehydrogenase family)
MAVNLDAPFHLTRFAAAHMVERGWGRIVMVASTAAQVAYPAPAYCASKAGLLGLMRATAVDVGAHGVTCNAVCPGSVRTEMADSSAEWLADRQGVTADKVWQERAALYPAGRVLEPREVAAAVAFLATPAASGINGEAITIALGGLR